MAYTKDSTTNSRGMFGVGNIFVNPDLRLKPYSGVIIWNSDLLVNDVHWAISATTSVLLTPDFPLLFKNI